MKRSHKLQRNALKLRKESYVNGRISEMINQGKTITPFEIVKLEVEAKKLVMSRDEFIRMIITLRSKFNNNEKLIKYFDGVSESCNFMTPC